MDLTKYDNHLKYPKWPKKRCPCCNSFFPDDAKFCSECGENVKVYYKSCVALYKKQKVDYDNNTRRLMEQFKKDALEYAGLDTLSNKDKIYDLAWREGHSSGLHEVVYWLEELSELFE